MYDHVLRNKSKNLTVLTNCMTSKSTHFSRFAFAFDEDVPVIRRHKFLGINTDVVLGFIREWNLEDATNIEQTLPNRDAMFNAIFCSLENLGPTMSHSHIASSFRSFLLFIFIIYDWPKIIRSVTFESEHRKSYVGKHIHGEYTG